MAAMILTVWIFMYISASLRPIMFKVTRRGTNDEPTDSCAVLSNTRGRQDYIWEEGSNPTMQRLDAQQAQSV